MPILRDVNWEEKKRGDVCFFVSSSLLSKPSPNYQHRVVTLRSYETPYQPLQHDKTHTYYCSSVTRCPCASVLHVPTLAWDILLSVHTGKTQSQVWMQRRRRYFCPCLDLNASHPVRRVCARTDYDAMFQHFSLGTWGGSGLERLKMTCFTSQKPEVYEGLET